MDLYNIWLSMTLGSALSDGGEIAKLSVTPQKLYENRHSWHQYEVFTAKQMARALEVPLEAAEQVQQIHAAHDIMSVNYTDSEYPECFRQIPQAPLVLFYKGDLSLLSTGNRLGIVGSRNPDRDGIKICDEICTILAQNAVTIISGLAQGLDSVAHKAALACGGKTVAFIGTSLDKAYPASHRNLQDEICSKGCVVSEYWAGAATPATTFLERNRLIAAASDAVCVMQAKAKSGSLSTAKRAVEYSKQLFAVPGSITNPLYDGSNRLIQDGAYPVLGAEDVLIFFGMAEDKTKAKRKAKPKLSEYEQKIYDCIGRESKSTNQIFSQTRIPMVQLKALLTKMEMDGVIASQAAGVYCIK
ncbi:MAG: DNA-protecting protein DprA [Ruminococcaceae bacterium]|nr:DNA-protecting protein DprA [Oscillospiraceae bacterium]